MQRWTYSIKPSDRMATVTGIFSRFFICLRKPKHETGAELYASTAL
jgi:hypothetical protein